MFVLAVVEYMGCFKDMEERAMTGTNIVSDSQDITACARECIQQGHNYLGLQVNLKCKHHIYFDQGVYIFGTFLCL